VTVHGGDAIAEAPPLVNAQPRVRGISNSDAVVVAFISAMAGAFLVPDGAVGAVLIAGVAAAYAAFRITRGLTMRRRWLWITASLVVPLLIAAALDDGGF
jgi:hypothetical protein